MTAPCYGPDHPHPRGLIGEIIANMLIGDGWHEETRAGESYWHSPDDTMLCTLEQAHTHARLKTMSEKIYMLRIPAISLLWHTVAANSEDEALEKIVKKINSKTVDYADRSCWEIQCVNCVRKKMDAST